ncbi:MAG: hypothetical protein LBG52_08455 [Candidatus Peribacteria bacterium]|jgi:hypothetical protein|nr:hypothetical protein [Candidatus Peribacteria bacterium]
MRDGTTSQFIQVYYKNELIIDTDGGGEGSLNVIINYKNIPIKIKSIYENKDDIRYIHHNQAYVGSIALPKKYVGLGFLKFIYQQISNTL